MNAVISGRAGTAVLIDGNSLFSFDAGDANTLVPRQQSDLPFLLGDASDLQFLENIEPDQARQQLEIAYNNACALDLTLILLDSELSDEVRTEAAEGLEELFADSQIVEQLEHLLCARPLPDAADILGAIERSEKTGAKTVAAVMQSLLDRQPFIREVVQAWDAISANDFGGEGQKAEFQRVVINEGLFRALVTAYLDGKVEGFLIAALMKPPIRALRNHRDVLQQWAAGFRSRVSAPEIQEPEEELGAEAQESRGRQRRHQSIDRAKVLENVQKRKQIIIEHMQRRDFDYLHSLVDELVEYHIANGGAEFAVKSLCNLAMEAKLLGNYPLQLELTERSINLQPDDSWSWAQYADALLRMGRPVEALKAYEQAAGFGSGAVAKNGRAETLRALGRPNEALAAYDDTIASHPENVVAKTGRAETLRALGRLPEALVAYDDIIINHPENVVAKNGRAETLRALGRLPEALAAYDDAIANHPENDVAKRGRSCVLMALRRYEEALANLPEKELHTLGDWIGYHIRGMVLLRMGRVNEALQVFEQGVINNPWPSDREYFRTALGIAWIRQQDFPKATKVLEEVSMPMLQPQVDILRIHSYGAEGKIDLAQAAYNRVSANPQFQSDELAGELHRRYLLRKQPQRDDEWVFDQEVNLFIAANQNLISSSLSGSY